jgi:hypothetical protein
MNPSVDNLSVQIIFQGVLVLTLSSRGLSHLDLDQRKWQFKYPEHGLVSEQPNPSLQSVSPFYLILSKDINVCTLCLSQNLRNMFSDLYKFAAKLTPLSSTIVQLYRGGLQIQNQQRKKSGHEPFR